MSPPNLAKQTGAQEPDSLDLLHYRTPAFHGSLSRMQTLHRNNDGLFFPVTPQDTSGDLARKILGFMKNHAGIQSNDPLRRKVDRLIQEQGRDLSFLNIFQEEHAGWQAMEWQQVLEKLTVHETCFYRDSAQLKLMRQEFLRDHIRAMARTASPILRIWSAATSTGEEAYTLAMLAVQELMSQQEARFATDHEILIDPRWTIEVLGTDISNRVLSHARAGRYLDNGSLSTFRALPDNMRVFFQRETADRNGDPPCYQIIPSIRKLVRFQQHNLNCGKPGMENADLVVCRNVMIYFDDATRLEVQKELCQALNPSGCLVLGPADNNLLFDRYTAHWGEKSVFYLRRNFYGTRRDSGSHCW